MLKMCSAVHTGNLDENMTDLLKEKFCMQCDASDNCRGQNPFQM